MAPLGSIYTYVGNIDPNNKNSIIRTTQGDIAIGQYGYFLPQEYQAAVENGFDLQPGVVAPAVKAPPQSFWAIIGNDGTVGGAGGSPLNTDAIASQLSVLVPTGTPPSPDWQLVAWTAASAFRLVSATRDGNGTITTASVVWPDGATGTFTTDTASATFPGSIDAYHVTYVYGSGPTTKTITQPAVTRDATGAVTAQPALTVT